MNITINTQGFEQTEAIQTHVERQLGMNLASFSNQIVTVRVYLSDINGPRGGVDKKAVITVSMNTRHLLTVERVRRDLYASVTVAARHMRRGIKRTLNKHRRMEKLSLRDLELHAQE